MDLRHATFSFFAPTGWCLEEGVKEERISEYKECFNDWDNGGGGECNG